MGLNLQYNQTYSSATNEHHLNRISEMCTSSTFICIACNSQDDAKKARLIACSTCWDVFNLTVIRTPRLSNGVYWFRSLNFNFGFKSVDSNILEIVWHTSEIVNGERCGTVMNGESTFNKLILMI